MPIYSVRVSSGIALRGGTRRRGGLSFTGEETLVNSSSIDVKQLDAILADEHLRVKEVAGDEPAPARRKGKGKGN